MVYAQGQDEKAAVVFDELYDEPYSINKLFIGFQPSYGEAVCNERKCRVWGGSTVLP
ncbi:MAG: hypothetical protein U5K54_23645 [Cytophagales bacterium]|nr:hypothetical protein [Cytophagales bacterium]